MNFAGKFGGQFRQHNPNPGFPTNKQRERERERTSKPSVCGFLGREIKYQRGGRKKSFSPTPSFSTLLTPIGYCIPPNLWKP